MAATGSGLLCGKAAIATAAGQGIGSRLSW